MKHIKAKPSLRKENILKAVTELASVIKAFNLLTKRSNLDIKRHYQRFRRHRLH